MRFEERKINQGDLAEQTQETCESSPGQQSPVKTSLPTLRGNRAGLSPLGVPNSRWCVLRRELLVTKDARLEQALTRSKTLLKLFPVIQLGRTIVLSA